MAKFNLDLLDDVESYYPLPLPDLAANLQDCVGGPNKDWNLLTRLAIAGFEKTWILTSCIAVSEYLRLRPQLDQAQTIKADDRVQPLFEDPKSKLSMGAWWGLFRDVTEALGSVRDQMIIPQLYEFHFNDHGKRTKVSKTLENVVLPWRNRYAHPDSIPIGEAARPDALRGMEQLDRMFGEMSFFRHYVLIQTNAALGTSKQGDSYETGFKVLRGLKVRTRTYDMGQQVEADKLYLAPLRGLKNGQLTLDEMLCLSPFLVYEYCKDCAQEEFFYYSYRDKQNRLQFKSHSNDCKFSVGVDQELHQVLIALIQQLVAGVSPSPGPGQDDGKDRRPVVSAEQLLHSSQARFQNLLTAKQEIYNKDIYVERTCEEVLRNFLRNPSKAAAIITGRSGMGKTSLFCSTLSCIKDTDIICYIDCVTLIHDEVVGLEQRIADELGIPCSLEEALAQLYPPEATPEELMEAPQLVLVFDAINAYKSMRSDSATLYKRILLLVSRLTGKARVLASCSTATWSGLKTLQPLPPHLYMLQGSEPLRLRGFDEREAEPAYRQYARAFDLQTNWEQIEDEVRERIRDPNFLKLLAETHRGKPLPQRISGLKLFEEYYLTISQSFEANELETAMVELLRRITVAEQPSVPLDDGLRASMGSGYEKLKDLGVLAEQGTLQKSVSFRFERFLEYLLALYFEDASEDRVSTILELIPQSAAFPTLRAVIVHMVLREVGEDGALISCVLEDSSTPRGVGIMVEALDATNAESPDRFLDCLRSLSRSRGRSVRQVAARVLGVYLARARNPAGAIGHGLEIFRIFAVDADSGVRDAAVHAYAHALRGNFDVGIAIFSGISDDVLVAIRDLKSIRILNLVSRRNRGRLSALVETYSGMVVTTLGEHSEKPDRRNEILEVLSPFAPEIQFIFEGVILDFMVKRIERAYRENERYPSNFHTIQSNLDSESGRSHILAVCELLGSDAPITESTDKGSRFTAKFTELLNAEETVVSVLICFLLSHRITCKKEESDLIDFLLACLDGYEKGNKVAKYNLCTGLGHSCYATEEPDGMKMQVFRDVAERFIVENEGCVAYGSDSEPYDSDMVSLLGRACLFAGDNRIEYIDAAFEVANEDDNVVFYDHLMACLGELGASVANPDVLMSNLRTEIEDLLNKERSGDSELILEMYEARQRVRNRLQEENRTIIGAGEAPRTIEARRSIVINEIADSMSDEHVQRFGILMRMESALEFLVRLRWRHSEGIDLYLSSFHAPRGSFLDAVSIISDNEPFDESFSWFAADMAWHKLIDNYAIFRTQLAHGVAESVSERHTFRYLFGNSMRIVGSRLANQENDRR